MQFQYTAKSMDGQTTTGTIEAAALSAARQQLRQQGLFVLSLVSGKPKPGTTSLRTPTAGVKKSEILMFTTQLAIMCRSGIELAEALQNLAEQCTDPVLKRALSAVHQDVQDGKSVSAALEKQGHIFGDAYVAGVAAGEASGTVTEVLGRLADLLRNEIRLRSTVRSVLAYPVMLLGLAMLVVSALVFFVLPQFSKVFADLGTPAPPLTQMLLDSAEFIRSNILILGMSCILLVGVAVRFWFTGQASRYWDGVVLHAALFRGATRALLTGRTFRLIGMMLESRIPLLEALRLCRSSIKNRLFRELFRTIEEDVLNGKGLSPGLSAASFIPTSAAQMVATAERTGRLGPVLQMVGEYYEEDGERRIRQLAKLLEPAIIVIMGLVVGTVVLSVMLPLLDVSTVSK